MPVHRIRLLGPWEIELEEAEGQGLRAKGQEEAAPLAAQGTVKMPCRWEDVFGSSLGSATLSRRFHCPTNLDSNEQVFIVITGACCGGTATLNGNPLGNIICGQNVAEFEVTKQLSKFNELAITLCWDGDAAADQAELLIAEVALEIRSD